MPLPDTIRDLIQTLANIGPLGWIEATCLLLEGGSESLEQLARTVRDRRERVRSGGAPWAMARLGLEDSLLCYMASRTADPEKLALYVAATKYHHRRTRAVGIGQSVDDPSSICVSVQSGEWKPDPAMDEALHELVGTLTTRDQMPWTERLSQHGGQLPPRRLRREGQRGLASRRPKDR